MRTRINAGWVVGFEHDQHHVLRDGVCVVENDHVAHVGKSYEGPVDTTIDAPGKLLTPGLITTHVHAGINAGEYVFLDRGRPEAEARNYLNWQAQVRGRPRYRENTRTAVLFGLGQCLRAGATTILEIGCNGDPPRFVELVEELGARVYTGPSYRNVVIYSHEDGRLDYDWDEERGTKGFKAAIEFAERYDESVDGRVRAVLCPGHTDTCTRQLLADTAREADAANLPVTIHAAINPVEMEHTLEMYRLTPIQLLAETGLLGTNVLLGHCVFVAGHSWSRYPDAPDLQLLGESRTTVSHSPLKYLHSGAQLESLRRYIQAGVNVTIGTDFAPGDVLAEMRCAMLQSRVADRSFLSGTPRDVFDAATVNAARAFGRDDLGRLAPGAKADLVIWDLQRTHYGAVHDPIKSLVDNGMGADAELVMVDGKIVVRDGELVTVNERELLAACQAEAEQSWADVPSWMWGGRDIEQIVPTAYPID